MNKVNEIDRKDLFLFHIGLKYVSQIPEWMTNGNGWQHWTNHQFVNPFERWKNMKKPIDFHVYILFAKKSIATQTNGVSRAMTVNVYAFMYVYTQIHTHNLCSLICCYMLYRHTGCLECDVYLMVRLSFSYLLLLEILGCVFNYV